MALLRKKKLFLFIYLIWFFPTVIYGQESRESKNLILNDAIKIAKEYYNQKASAEGYGIIDKMNIQADDENSTWNEYIKIIPRILNGPNIKKMRLKQRDYWAIYFSPKKELVLGGDVLIFIDKKTGKIIGELWGR